MNLSSDGVIAIAMVLAAIVGALAAMLTAFISVIKNADRLTTFFRRELTSPRWKRWRASISSFLAGVFLTSLVTFLTLRYSTPAPSPEAAAEAGAPPEAAAEAGAPPPEVLWDVQDNSFIPGRDDIDLIVINQGDSLAVVEQEARLRIGMSQCDVTLQGDLVLDSKENSVVLVDGSRRNVTAPIGVPLDCRLQYNVRNPTSGQTVTHLFEFKCERQDRGGIVGDNLC